MRFKQTLAWLFTSACVSAALAVPPDVNNPDWAETEVPPPPAFSLDKLVSFDAGSIGAALVFAIDPSTIRITRSDNIVRYVMVATSSSGTKNILYEGIRCSTAEVKTYARYSPEGKWNQVSDPQWKPLNDSSPSKHALRLAKAGACDNTSTALSAETMVARLQEQQRFQSEASRAR